VNIWKGNTSRTYLDKMGLNEYAEGEGGPIYGHQFRHFGGRWKIDENGHRVYVDGGVDQVDEVLYLLREEPNSRRILINLWNPSDLDKMALPPCHMVYQFRVYNGKLSCSMYQRSCDTFLGLPFNICSTALMTYIFAKLTGLVPDEIIISLGDTHIYKNHLEQVKTQLKRVPYSFPKLNIKNRTQKSVEDFKVEDFEILCYQSHPALSGQMAV
jgi:thymidylate synthase